MPVDDCHERNEFPVKIIFHYLFFSLKYSNILIRFFDELSPLILLDKKFKL